MTFGYTRAQRNAEMKQVTYLVGEPVFQHWNRDVLIAPAGEADLCVEVLQETSESEEIIARSRREYLSIISSLETMGIPFHIVYAHPDLVDRPTVAACAEAGRKFARFGKDFFPPAVAFPRDFSTVLPTLVLFHEQAKVLVGKTDGWTLLSSPFGEGGRVLSSGTTMVVCERLCEKDGGESRAVTAEDLDPIASHGIAVATAFAPVLQRVRTTGPTDELAISDHIDRAGALLSDANGNLHLILGPNVTTARMIDEEQRLWEPVGPRRTKEMLARALRSLGINVHLAPSLKIPYALNLLQFADRRVLMTGGDTELSRFIETLVGKGKVVTTDVPIRYMPTWRYGGIRCLVSEEPLPIKGPRRGTQ